MKKVDWGAVPQLPFPGNSELVYTGGYLHAINKARYLRVDCRFAFLLFLFFNFENTLFL